jgi:hypothetical protein
MKTKRLPKLKAIENKLCRLWTNREDRARYLEIEMPTAGQIGDEGDFVREIDPSGVKLYSSLIEIGRMDLMSSIYPVIEKLLGKQFRPLVFDYFESMPPVHFNLNRSASRFPQYVIGLEKLMTRYPFLAELADYEWIELEVLEDPTPDAQYVYSKTGMDIDPVYFAGLTPVLNSVYIARRYLYAIPTLSEEIEEGKKLPRRVKQDPTWTIVYRDPETLDARFLTVDEVSFKMLETIKGRPAITYGELIKEICSQYPDDVQNTLVGLLETIEQFKTLKLIVGEKSATESAGEPDAAVASKKLVKKSGRA